MMRCRRIDLELRTLRFLSLLKRMRMPKWSQSFRFLKVDRAISRRSLRRLFRVEHNGNEIESTVFDLMEMVVRQLSLVLFQQAMRDPRLLRCQSLKKEARPTAGQSEGD